MPNSLRNRLGINRTVFILGIVSLLTDISSEGIYPLIPLFLTSVLNTSIVDIGLIEGIAQSTASIARIFSGWISDRLGDRKWVTTVGYGLSTISKPLLAISSSWQQVFGIRFADRLGKGIRSAPRDALIADVTPPESRGISFGFHRAMDTVGAITGPLLAFWLLRSVGLSYRSIFWLSAVPGILAVIVLIVFVRNPARKSETPEKPPSLSMRGFSRNFKLFLIIVVIFSLGNSSDAFLILRARDIGIAPANILLVYVLFNTVEASFSMAAGAASDRLGRKNVILTGFIIFTAVYAGFGAATRPTEIWILFGVYGLFNALTQGVQRAFASDLVSAETRGTGLGAYHMATGIALLPASLIAGFLWQNIGPSAPFYYGASMALIASMLLIVLFRNSTTIYTGR